MAKISLCTCCRHYPGAAAGRTLRSASPSRISLPRKSGRVGLRIVLFEVCSAFTRVTACTLALSPIRDTLIEGFSHFVTSMTAPIASGWSGCRVGLAPTGERRLVTARSRIITPLAVITGLGTIVSVQSFSRPCFGQQKESSIRKACSTRECSSIRKTDRLCVPKTQTQT